MSQHNDHFGLLAIAPAILLGLMLGLMLGGCSDLYFDRRDSISLAAGDAMRINKVTLMTDPWPPASANKDIAFSGDRMQCAVERYRTHRELPPITSATSRVYGPAAEIDKPAPGCPPPKPQGAGAAPGGAPPGGGPPGGAPPGM
jgi:hypothetical protein